MFCVIEAAAVNGRRAAAEAEPRVQTAADAADPH